MNSEATESTGFYEFLAWLEINKKRLVIGLIAAAVVGLGVATYCWTLNQREAAASAALFRLGLPITPSEAAAPSASSYLKLAGEYPHTRAGKQALLLAAGELFKSGHFDEAQAQFKAFLNENSDSALAPTAAFGLASTLDALNRTDEAQQAYQAVVSRYPASPIVAQARLALARVFEAKKQPDQALKIYDQLIQSPTPDTWASEARARREELLFKYPGLAPAQSANAPGALSTSPQSLFPVPSPATQTPAPLAATNTIPRQGQTNRPAVGAVKP